MWEQKDYWMHLEAKSPLEKYPAKQHAQRVAEKLGVSDGLIYLRGEPLRLKEDSDMPQPFYQRRYFYYLSGCNETDCHLAYDIQNDSLTLFIPSINPSRVIWSGRGSTPAEALDKYDIDQVFLNNDLERFVKKWATYHKGSLYILHDDQGPAKVTTGARVDSTSLQHAIDSARVIKDAYEIALIRKANAISSKAHREVLARIRDFKNEAQVEGLFMDVCISENAKQQAYAPIAASGTNAGTLHYDNNDEPLEGRQLMCLDAGCSWGNYASDITRTFPLSGEWTKEAKEIYDLVERMQEACIKRLGPGVRYLDLHVLAHQIAIDGLLSLGILYNGTKEEIFKAGTSRAFFPHGLGHHVGLEVHDVGHKELVSVTVFSPNSRPKAPSIYPANFYLPVYDAKSCRSPVDPSSPHLDEGMVVTVEPGIYFSAYALEMFYLPSPVHSKYINKKVLARYMPVGGVRIEDDILITSKGYENLTTAPKGDAMLEIIRSRNAEPTKFSWFSPPRETHISPPGLELRSSRSREHRTNRYPQPLRRAPGISGDALEPMMKPLSSDSDLETKRGHRRSSGSGDFEPFNGPTLFDNFKPAASRAPKMAERKHSAPSPQVQRQESRSPVCGDDSPEYSHAYMNFSASKGKADNILPMHAPRSGPRPICRKCAVLVQTIDRLRHNFSNPSFDSNSSQINPGETAKAPSQHPEPRNPFRQFTAPVPKPVANPPHNPLAYRQSLPNIKQDPFPISTSKPLFTSGTFTAEPESHKPTIPTPRVFASPHRKPQVSWDEFLSQRPPTTGMPTPEMVKSSYGRGGSIPATRPLSQTLDQVEEELIGAVKRLRVIGERAEGKVKMERRGGRNGAMDVDDLEMD